MQVHTDWLLTPERAAVHLPTATAVIADLHLGYDEARRRRGEAVPESGLDDVVAVLRSLLVRETVRRLVIAGDLLEDSRCTRQAEELLAWLDSEGVALAGVVPGNHDRGLGQQDGGLPLCPAGVVLGGWRVVHGDGRLPRGRLVCGHWHPCLRWGRRVTAPCFLVGPRRLILPAFSADAAGASVLGERAWRNYRCYAIVGDKVLDFGEVALLRRIIV
jgi:hypothetical protein